MSGFEICRDVELQPPIVDKKRNNNNMTRVGAGLCGLACSATRGTASGGVLSSVAMCGVLCLTIRAKSLIDHSVPWRVGPG